MAILVLSLTFLAVAALGLVTALTILKGLQPRKLVQRKELRGCCGASLRVMCETNEGASFVFWMWNR
jgi:hypothetical protein